MLNNRRASSVSKNKIVFWYQRAEWIVFVGFDSCQGSRGVDVPERDPSTIRAALQHFGFEEFVIRPYSAVLDYDI